MWPASHSLHHCIAVRPKSEWKSTDRAPPVASLALAALLPLWLTDFLGRGRADALVGGGCPAQCLCNINTYTQNVRNRHSDYSLHGTHLWRTGAKAKCYRRSCYLRTITFHPAFGLVSPLVRWIDARPTRSTPRRQPFCL